MRITKITKATRYGFESKLAQEWYARSLSIRRQGQSDLADSLLDKAERAERVHHQVARLSKAA